jgi:hypothetical protein
MKFEYVFFGIFALVAANMLRKVAKNREALNQAVSATAQRP